METYDFRCTLYFQSLLHFPSSALSPQLRFAKDTWASRLDCLFPMLLLFRAIFGDTGFAIPPLPFPLIFPFSAHRFFRGISYSSAPGKHVHYDHV